MKFKNYINNKETLLRLLKGAIEHESDKNEANNEYLAMLASGRYLEIPEKKRKALLENIVGNPQESFLLKSLYNLKMAENTGISKNRTLRIITVSWSVAACLMIGLFVWKAIDSSGSYQGNVQLRPFSSNQESDYWSQLDKQRLSLQTKWHVYRDIALLASTSTCFVLSAGLVFMIRKNRHG